jgi:hypothetical protein
MAETDPIDRYFTRNIVGDAMVVDMGVPAPALLQATSPAWVEVLGDRAGAAALAVRSLWTDEPGEVLAGRPVDLPALALTQRRLLLAGGLGWLVALAALAWVLLRR